VLDVAGRAGLGALVGATPWRRRRLAILCYHGISLADEHEWHPELYMPPAQFRARMRRLRALGCHPLPLGEAVERLYAGTLPPRSVVVTFDDGFHDFAAAALPVLREFDIPATNYVATFYSRFPRPVFDPACAYLLWKARARGPLVLPEVTGDDGALPLRTAAERQAAWVAIGAHARAAGLDAGGKDALLARVAGALDLDYAAWVGTRMLQQMRPDELRALPRDLVDVQLHTHRHRMPDDRALLAREIDDNRVHLAAMLGDDAPRRHFCYPSGACDPTRRHWLAALGVRSATTGAAGLAAPDDDPLLLPRFTDTTLQPMAVFDAWVSGLWPALRGRDRVVRRRASAEVCVDEPTRLPLDGAADARGTGPAGRLHPVPGWALSVRRPPPVDAAPVPPARATSR
jgi:peptidoglycan/xylan/chitin deacetylase (PgdA/CDA1 family)